MDELDKQIKDYFEREALHLPKGSRLKTAPAVDVFYQFLMDKLEGEALEEMLAYLKANPEAQTMVSQARLLLEKESEAEGEKIPTDWVRKAKDLVSKNSSVHCPYCGRTITPFKKPIARQNVYNLLWIVASVVSFSVSFFFRHYFYQCLALALFFGIKWSLDRRATKTQILIYKALKDEQTSGSSRDLHNLSSHL